MDWTEVLRWPGREVGLLIWDLVGVGGRLRLDEWRRRVKVLGDCGIS